MGLGCMLLQAIAHWKSIQIKSRKVNIPISKYMQKNKSMLKTYNTHKICPSETSGVYGERHAPVQMVELTYT